MAKIELIVPDLGNFDDVDVIDIPVKVGDTVAIDDTLMSLESDKASIDVPAEQAGTITEILVSVGDKVKEGVLFMCLEASADAPIEAATKAPEKPVEKATQSQSPIEKAAKSTSSDTPVAILVPDIGNFDEVDVIDVAVNVGDMVEVDQILATLESDKASMDLPADKAGKVVEVAIKVGDKIKEGDLVVKVMASAVAEASVATAPKAVEEDVVRAESISAERGVFKAPHAGDQIPKPSASAMEAPATVDFTGAHASPSVRAFARELGADLNQVTGTGRKARVLREDVIKYIKDVLSGSTQVTSQAGGGSGVGLDLLPWPKVDFSKFGEIETHSLTRIQKISGANLARNWVKIPHVAQFDEADITELEALRRKLNKENERNGARVTILAFLVKAVVSALQKYPKFNSSIVGDELVLKKYYHIGFAADTPNGLVVPVIRDCDKKGVMEIAAEMGELAGLARDGKLTPDQMQGGCFTISSLGGIGGTNFIPIINAPEVAILGVARNQIKPIWNGKEFEPRTILPLSLSYDHRVIDGALGARFIVYLNQLLEDMRRALI